MSNIEKEWDWDAVQEVLEKMVKLVKERRQIEYFTWWLILDNLCKELHTLLPWEDISDHSSSSDVVVIPKAYCSGCVYFHPEEGSGRRRIEGFMRPSWCKLGEGPNEWKRQ